MSTTTSLQAIGFSYAKARLIADELRSLAPVARRHAADETLYRPENKLADRAVLLGVPLGWAKSIAFDVLDEVRPGIDRRRGRH